MVEYKKALNKRGVFLRCRIKTEKIIMEKKTNKYNLPERETEILYALWNAGRPLLASEIADVDEDLKIATVHTTLKRMLKKHLIEVVDFAKSGNVFGRCYQPTISLEEFELNKLSNDFKRKQCKDITTSRFVAALLEEQDSNTALEELEELEKMIQEQRAKIMNDN